MGICTYPLCHVEPFNYRSPNHILFLLAFLIGECSLVALINQNSHIMSKSISKAGKLSKISA